MSSERVEDLLFNCPLCTGALVADALQRNLPGHCSHCRQDITIPDGLARLEKSAVAGVRRVMKSVQGGSARAAEAVKPRVKPPFLECPKEDQNGGGKMTPAAKLQSAVILEAELKKVKGAYAEGQKELEQLRATLKESKIREAALKAKAEEAEKEAKGLRRELEQAKAEEAAGLADLDTRFQALQEQLDASTQSLAQRATQESKLKVALGRLESGTLEVLRLISERQRGK